MKKVLFAVILISSISSFGQPEYLSIKARKIDKIPIVFSLLIDRHIKVMKKRGLKESDNNIIVIDVSRNILLNKYLRKSKLDSLYSDTFSMDYPQSQLPYEVLAITLNKSNPELFGLFNDFMGILYFKQNNWDIFFVSNQLKFISKNVVQEKEFIFCDRRFDHKVISYTNNYTLFEINMWLMMGQEIVYKPLDSEKSKDNRSDNVIKSVTIEE